jgi:hypothetical protein
MTNKDCTVISESFKELANRLLNKDTAIRKKEN